MAIASCPGIGVEEHHIGARVREDCVAAAEALIRLTHASHGRVRPATVDVRWRAIVNDDDFH
jgi:hypothetical protein